MGAARYDFTVEHALRAHHLACTKSAGREALAEHRGAEGTFTPDVLQ